jgi:hypothetical protein
MGLKHTWKKSVSTDLGGSLFSGSSTYEASAEENFIVDVVSGDTLEIDLAIDVSQLVSFAIYSTKDITLKTNDLSAPAQTQAIVEKVAFGWNEDDPGANPLTVDVTKHFLVNDGDDDAVVKASFLLDLDT